MGRRHPEQHGRASLHTRASGTGCSSAMPAPRLAPRSRRERKGRRRVVSFRAVRRKPERTSPHDVHRFVSQFLLPPRTRWPAPATSPGPRKHSIHPHHACYTLVGHPPHTASWAEFEQFCIAGKSLPCYFRLRRRYWVFFRTGSAVIWGDQCAKSNMGRNAPYFPNREVPTPDGG